MEQFEQMLCNSCNSWYFIISLTIVMLLELPITCILNKIKCRIKIDAPFGIAPDRWDKLIMIPGKFGGGWIGRCDRLLFFVSLWASAHILVVGWLAFKVAAKWESWNNLTQVPTQLKGADELDYFKARARWASRTMQRFVVGTGLNLIAAFIGLGVYYSLIVPCP